MHWKLKMKEDIKRIKETYVKGMRVRLVKMDDEQAPPIGMEGTIRGVDAIGSVLVMWDTGSKLNVILEDDEIEIIKENNDSKIYTVYSSEADISFIMEDRNNSIAVVGFYFGEPNERMTSEYYGKLVAIIE